MAETNLSEFSRRLAIFSINMYSKLTLLKPNENIIFSPFSIQTCAAMARMGAEQQTAAEMDHGLGLIGDGGGGDLNEIAENYYKVLTAYERSNVLHIANKIYVKQGYGLREEFNALLTKKFLSSAEELDFSQSTAAANAINTWVAAKTDKLITQLIAPGALSEQTRMVLVNAIHFKGEWLHGFPKHLTQDEDFYVNEEDTLRVPMMHVREHLNYANLDDLDAQALELPYKDTDLSMLLILPNSRTGLKQLEAKLKAVLLSEITNKLQKVQTSVKLPKFKAEFEIELTEPFKQLGMSRMFSDSAEFGKMLQSPETLKVSTIIHKAVIDVNEVGTEAAAASGMYICLGALPLFQPQPQRFFADRPFYYAIINKLGQHVFVGNMHG